MRHFLCIAIMATSSFWPLIGGAPTFDPRSTKDLPSCDDYPALNNLQPINDARWKDKVIQIVSSPNHACWFESATGNGAYVLSPLGALRES
jgi:hypothetical protein